MVGSNLATLFNQNINLGISPHPHFEYGEMPISSVKKKIVRYVFNNDTNEEKRNLIMAIGKNLFLNDKKLEFSFKKPFDILLIPEYRTNGLVYWE